VTASFEANPTDGRKKTMTRAAWAPIDDSMGGLLSERSGLVRKRDYTPDGVL
jgi:hypothetical protein